MAGIAKYVSDFQINMFPIAVSGSLVGVKRTGLAKESALVNICPECEEPHKVKQNYSCEAGHGPYTVGQLQKAKEVSKGTFVRLSAEDVSTARASDLTLNMLELTAHKADAVDAQTFESDSAYVFYPKVANQQYGVLLDLVSDPELAFIGVVNLRNSERLVRLRRWGSNLVVQTLWYPEELNPRELVEVKYEQKFLDMTKQLVDGLVEDFEPTAYTNRQRERLASLAADGNAVVTTVTPSAPKDSDAAALAALEALLQKRTAT